VKQCDHHLDHVTLCHSRKTATRGVTVTVAVAAASSSVAPSAVAAASSSVAPSAVRAQKSVGVGSVEPVERNDVGEIPCTVAVVAVLKVYDPQPIVGVGPNKVCWDQIAVERNVAVVTAEHGEVCLNL
jgi:hypothetical protein